MDCLTSLPHYACQGACRTTALPFYLAMVLARRLSKSSLLKTLETDARRQRKLGNSELMLVQLNKHFRVRSPGSATDFMHLQAPTTICDIYNTNPRHSPSCQYVHLTHAAPRHHRHLHGSFGAA